MLLLLLLLGSGNRPSTSLLLPELNAYTVGQLLALYEHQVAVQVRGAGGGVRGRHPQAHGWKNLALKSTQLMALQATV